MGERRFLTAIVAILAFGLIAVGCGGDEDDQVTDDPGTELDVPAVPAPEDLEQPGEGAEGAIGEEEAREQTLEFCRERAEEALSGPALERQLEFCEAAFGG